MTDYQAHPLFRKHNLDSAMDSLWSFYRKNFIALFIISFILAVIINLLTKTTEQSELFKTMEQDPEMLLPLLKSYFIDSLPALLMTIAAYTLLSYYVLLLPVKEVSLSSLAKGMGKYLPTFLIILVFFAPLVVIASVAGLVVFIIGILFAFIWLTGLFMFLLPTLMVEGNIITNSIIRSFRLFHRYFLMNIGWTALILVIAVIVSLLLSLIVTVPFSGALMKGVLNPDAAAEVIDIASNPFYIILSSAASALIMPIFPIFSLILYFNAIEEEVKQDNEDTDNYVQQ